MSLEYLIHVLAIIVLWEAGKILFEKLAPKKYKYTVTFRCKNWKYYKQAMDCLQTIDGSTIEGEGHEP